jgi:hypothetical protein
MSWRPGNGHDNDQDAFQVLGPVLVNFYGRNLMLYRIKVVPLLPMSINCGLTTLTVKYNKWLHSCRLKPYSQILEYGGSGWSWLAMAGCSWLWLAVLAVAGCGWLWLAVAGCGWLWLAVAGCGWLLLAVAGFGWLWQAVATTLTMPLY